jgi:hypothetical protein
MSERSEDAKVAALRTEIEQTRAELGETVELLTQRVDVKARAKEKVDETKARVKEKVDETKAQARQSAQQVAASGRELVQEVRADPAKSARLAVMRLRASVRQRPKEWATAVAALLAFAALVARRRRRSRSGRI